jgi:hypothetical protein
MQQLVRDIKAKPGGEEWVMDQLADGRTVRSIAEELGVSRRYLYMWRDRQGHRERLKPMWEAAVRLSAEADLEASIADFDRLDRVIYTGEDGQEERRVPQASEVQLATGRAKFRQWLAGRKDPEKYGEEKGGVNVNLNIGDLHVQAVESVKQAHRLEARTEAMPVEVVEEEQEHVEEDHSGLADLMG